MKTTWTTFLSLPLWKDYIEWSNNFRTIIRSCQLKWQQWITRTIEGRIRLATTRIMMTLLEMKRSTYNTCGRDKTYQMTTTQGPPIYSGPFSKFIMSMALLKNFQLPIMLKPYNGIGDPQVDVTMFKLMMLVNGVSDPFLYRTLPTILEKVALLWFSSLPSRLIHNFVELSQAFVNRFSLSWVYKKISDSLNAIQQGPQEPLREYLDRFNIVVMQIQDLDLVVELHFIKRGLRVSPFADSLAINLSSL